VLGDPGPQREEALTRLHQMLVRIARSEVRRRGPRLRISGPELDDLASQAAADALLGITNKIGEFRGESRFTTWAYKFVILNVSAKIGSHFGDIQVFRSTPRIGTGYPPASDSTRRRWRNTTI
jgi:RNA polymerase sigma-70 factor (ECF subfamily)